MPKPTFNAVTAEKRERVLRSTAMLFAKGGYAQTDMAALAEGCGIAKGSIYNYFGSKEELYLYVCRDGLARSRAAVWGTIRDGCNIFDLIDHIFRQGVEFARQHPEYVQLYLNLGSCGLERFADELSLEVEKPTADRLKDTIRAGIESGSVRSDLDVVHAAWLINNTYILFLASLVSQHFTIRMQEYLETDAGLSAAATNEQCGRAIKLLQDFLRPE